MGGGPGQRVFGWEGLHSNPQLSSSAGPKAQPTPHHFRSLEWQQDPLAGEGCGSRAGEEACRERGGGGLRQQPMGLSSQGQKTTNPLITFE